MLDYLAVGGIAFGLAYWIAGTGLALWRSIVGALLGFTIGWVGGTALFAFVLFAGDFGVSSFDRVIGRNFWFAFAGAGYGVHRGRKKLKAANTSLGNASQESAIVKTTANDAYAAALAEIEEGRLDKGVWARSFADSGGDESNAKASYIKARAESLEGASVDSVRVLPETKSVGLYEAAIGEKRQAYYVAAFDSLDQGAHGLNPSWNWAAFLFTGGWALYRKMYGWFFICVAVTAVGSLLYRSHGSEAFALISLSVAWVGFAVYANSIYHLKVKADISAAQKSISDPSKLAAYLSSEGGVHAWVPPIVGAIPVVGIVAAVALPAYQDYTKRTTVAGNPVQAPAERPAPSEFRPFTGQLDTVPVPTPVARSQIDEFLDGKPSPSNAERGPWEQYQYQDGVAANRRGDYAAALAIFHPLAEIGHADSQYNLGAMYRAGHGVPIDNIASAKWYRLAANQGHAVAQSQLAMMYEAGEGVAQNYREAAILHRMAAEQGNAIGQSGLGVAHLMGRGVPKDYLRAHMWFNLAAVSDASTNSMHNRDVVEQSMTAQQIAQAQQMARDCQQRNFKGCD